MFSETIYLYNFKSYINLKIGILFFGPPCILTNRYIGHESFEIFMNVFFLL